MQFIRKELPFLQNIIAVLPLICISHLLHSTATHTLSLCQFR